ncbi:MAG: hypothetical protein FWH18_05700 [Marinilabiliaceae bacterium]|nr:hypothetical protein [Marinilabiliaceae bacterium]
MKNILLTSIIACLMIGCDSNTKPRIRKDVNYPDVISPMYFIETFEIDDPRVFMESFVVS